MTLPVIDSYDDEKLEALRIAVLTEQDRRANLSRIPDMIGDLNSTYLNADGQESGGEWKQPLGAFDSYPIGWAVTHSGKTWESLIAANPYEPPTNWRETVEPGGLPPAWVQPTGSEDAYNTGDEVTFQGAVYRSVLDANTWSPTDYPAGWEQVV